MYVSQIVGIVVLSCPHLKFKNIIGTEMLSLKGNKMNAGSYNNDIVRIKPDLVLGRRHKHELKTAGI